MSTEKSAEKELGKIGGKRTRKNRRKKNSRSEIFWEKQPSQSLHAPLSLSLSFLSLSRGLNSSPPGGRGGMSAQPLKGGVADSGVAGPAAAVAMPPVDNGAAGKSMSPTTTTTLPPSSQQQQGQQQQQQSRHKVVIVWFRRDLRVSDNPALMAAAAEADFVVRLFGEIDTFLRFRSANRSLDFFL
jgi:hypothetical protein